MSYYKENTSWAKDLLAKKDDKKGFNAVLDCVGPANVDSTLELLGLDAKWVLFGLLSGAKTNLNMAFLLGKRIELISTTLKTRTDEYKSHLIDDFKKTALSGFEKGILKPIIFKSFAFNWQNVEPIIEAHKLMESNVNVGKIMIELE